jgi:glutaredoxin 3
MSRIIVFTTEPCSFCRRVKGLLEAHGLSFSEVNLAKDPHGRIELVNRTGLTTFPQVVVDGRVLGGYAEVEAAADSGQLKTLVAADPA